MDNGTKTFSLRAFASVLAGISFVLMVITGLVLFIAPSCRVARDSSWIVWGHDKDQWIAIHVWLSIVFVVASFIHIYLNWAILINYFKTKLHKGLAFRYEWVSALVICALIYAGTSYGVAPFSSLMLWKESFKHNETSAGQGYRGGRGLSRGFAAQQIQGPHGYAVPNEHGLQNEACSSCDESSTCEQGLTGQKAECTDSCESQVSSSGHGAGPGGMGRKTLRQFCSDEGIEISWAITHLKAQGLTVRETMTMRQIADAAGIHPSALRTLLAPRE